MTGMKHLLVIAIALCVVAALYSVAQTGKTKHLSISLHAAGKRRTQVVFGGMLFIATNLAAITLFGWLLPSYGVGLVSYIIFGVVITFLAVIALVPHIVGTWREPVHNLAAWGLAWIIPMAMLLMLTWPLNPWAWRIGACLTAINIVLIVLSIAFKQLRQWFLYFQSVYLALFLSFLLVATYL